MPKGMATGPDRELLARLSDTDRPTSARQLHDWTAKGLVATVPGTRQSSGRPARRYTEGSFDQAVWVWDALADRRDLRSVVLRAFGSGRFPDLTETAVRDAYRPLFARLARLIERWREKVNNGSLTDLSHEVGSGLRQAVGAEAARHFRKQTDQLARHEEETGAQYREDVAERLFRSLTEEDGDSPDGFSDVLDLVGMTGSVVDLAEGTGAGAGVLQALDRIVEHTTFAELQSMRDFLLVLQRSTAELVRALSQAPSGMAEARQGIEAFGGLLSSDYGVALAIPYALWLRETGNVAGLLASSSVLGEVADT